MIAAVSSSREFERQATPDFGKEPRAKRAKTGVRKNDIRGLSWPPAAPRAVAVPKCADPRIATLLAMLAADDAERRRVHQQWQGKASPEVISWAESCLQKIREKCVAATARRLGVRPQLEETRRLHAVGLSDLLLSNNKEAGEHQALRECDLEEEEITRLEQEVQCLEKIKAVADPRERAPDMSKENGPEVPDLDGVLDASDVVEHLKAIGEQIYSLEAEIAQIQAPLDKADRGLTTQALWLKTRTRKRTHAWNVHRHCELVEGFRT